MPTVQIGKYTRPGIYVEEFNDSAIETPVVTGLQTLVIGSSKKGPINSPVLINSQTELERIFGNLDTTLEANYSYFHRTISKVLESSPVLAMNIIDIDDDLDEVEYQSLSTSTGYKNDRKREAGYSRFFNTSSFWEKDREAFLSVTTDNQFDEQRILHFTNLNDRQVSMFIVKSQNTQGFDRTLRNWYGGSDKVPLYLDPLDYASDYLVDVVILPGDWTNYSSLAVDSEWSQYFSPEGLVKSELFNLANNTNANALAVFRNLSLIPYFTDATGNNIFIEDRINRRTDVTGIYCAYDIDAVETSYRNGLLDLIGNRLINSDISEIEMLSYKDSVTETIPYPETELDTPGNTYQLIFDGYYQSASASRTALNAEGFIGNMIPYFGAPGNPTLVTSSDFVDLVGGTSGGTPSTTISFGLEFAQQTVSDYDYAYSVIGGEKLILGTNSTSSNDLLSTTINANDFDVTSTTGSYYFYLNSDNEFIGNQNIPSSENNIILIEGEYQVGATAGGNEFTYISLRGVNITDNGYLYYDSNDINVTVNTNQNAITYEFLNTNSTDLGDALLSKKLKNFNDLASILTGPNADRSTILVDAGTNSNGNPWKKSVSELDISVNNSVGVNKTITIGGFETGTIGTQSILVTKGLVVHTVDNEFVLSQSGAITTNDYAGATYGVVSEYSELYQNYFNGIINSGDYFYENLIDGISGTSENIPSYIRLTDINGTDYLVSDVTLDIQNHEVLIPESTLNIDKIDISGDSPISSGLTGLGTTGSYYAYKTATNLTEETISNPTKLWLANEDDKIYVRMYLEDEKLTLEFVDSTLKNVITTYNKSIDIISQSSNFRQSIEVEIPTGYTTSPNKILVDASRYPELRIGNFLETEVGATATIGEVPKKVTRVISKKQYAGDPNLVEVTCDAAIRLYDFNGDKQTYRFTSIDDYVSTYKGINLFGFRVRPESLPGGINQITRENKLQDILNTIGKGTPLYNALTDKDIIDFRYIVDSYGMGLVENSKQQLADISGKRLDCFTFLNMPSMKDFRNAGTTFLDDNNRLSIDYVAQGGNPEAISQFSFSLAQGDAATTVGYFTPYVTITDNGRPKNVPPAAYVATTFLRKHNSSLTSVVPWTIAAGITNGQVTGISGLEFSFTGEDISALNGASVNPIVSKKNRGRVVETENTAETLANSALGNIHAREVLIEIEREIADMLLNFQWKFNTPEVRAEIKLRADAICEDYVTRNGLYNFFNKIDSENNTQEIIDNDMGVLDTYVEITRGLSVIVNNVTILRTGAISSSGFTPA